MLNFFPAILLFLFTGSTLGAQEYRLYTDDFIMPDLRNPVIISLKDDARHISSRKYKLESAKGATVLERANGGYKVLFDRDEVYRNNGIVHFTVQMDGATLPQTFTMPTIRNIRFNFYTDSIKPVLNYYVNVEGEFTDGSILPLDTSLVSITADNGHMDGMEWILPRRRDFEKVVFTATYRYDNNLTKTAERYLKKYADPRDDAGYQERTEEEIKRDNRRR